MPSYKQIVADAESMSLTGFTGLYKYPFLLGWQMLGGSLTKKAPLTAAYMRPGARDRGRRGSTGIPAGGLHKESTLVYKVKSGGETAQNPLADDAVESVELERPYVFILERTDLSTPGPVVIGRTVNADVTINDYSVSSAHAHLVYSDAAGFAQIKDTESTNGTAVGTKRLEEGEAEILQNGYWVTIGRVVCQFFTPKGLYQYITEPEPEAE